MTFLQADPQILTVSILLFLLDEFKLYLEEDKQQNT